jgi:hypothetical protein
MKALLVSYNLKKANINQKTTLHQTLYGYTDHSNGGRYKYRRDGLLSKYPSIKLNRGVFIIGLNDKGKIMPVLKKNKASISELIIDIPETMLKKS